MSISTSIGQASDIKGLIVATDEQGYQRLLDNGDNVYINEAIQTPPDSGLTIMNPETEQVVLQIPQATSLLVDESVLSGLEASESLMLENVIGTHTFNQLIHTGMFEDALGSLAGQSGTVNEATLLDLYGQEDFDMAQLGQEDDHSLDLSELIKDEADPLDQYLDFGETSDPLSTESPDSLGQASSEKPNQNVAFNIDSDDPFDNNIDEQHYDPDGLG